jgi:hypothetical protein
MRVFNQDPASDMGRRAAGSRLSIGACPYPEGNWLGDRWRAAWRAETERLGGLEHRAVAAPQTYVGNEPYSFEETDSIHAMLARGRDAAYIARALNRPLHSVAVKIGAMMKSYTAWSGTQDRDLIARVQRQDLPSLRQIAEELGRSVHSIGSRVAHHGGLKRLRAAAIAMARAAE